MKGVHRALGYMKVPQKHHYGACELKVCPRTSRVIVTTRLPRGEEDVRPVPQWPSPPISRWNWGPGDKGPSSPPPPIPGQRGPNRGVGSINELFRKGVNGPIYKRADIASRPPARCQEELKGLIPTALTKPRFLFPLARRGKRMLQSTAKDCPQQDGHGRDHIANWRKERKMWIEITAKTLEDHNGSVLLRRGCMWDRPGVRCGRSGHAGPQTSLARGRHGGVCGTCPSPPRNGRAASSFTRGIITRGLHFVPRSPKF